MYLKTIKLAGFKSFVDPTTIPVRGNMNAIVGPNGCGKSNVVDAIRWVIGESSAKQLRGQSMSDVIFNGTTTRNAVGRAAVELHFDNNAKRLTGEYAAYTEIAIRREVEQDGQSRYFLNGTHCRRKDILDIFLGTGLGPRSYSIIEQGMISRLIEAKPEDIRIYLEEVAGISKYKERRRETENRIRHTEENLERLNDIREELTKQLGHLKRQANAAERYQVYKQEERELSAEIKALQWQALHVRREQNQQRVREQENKREEQIALQREYEASLDKGKFAQEEATEQMHAVQTQFYTLGEDIARLEQQIKSHQSQLATWQKELEDIDVSCEELSNNTAEYHEQVQEIEAEVASLAPQSGQVNQVAYAAKQAYSEADASMQLWQQAWDEFQDQSSHVLSQAQVAESTVGHTEAQLTRLTQRKNEVIAACEAINVEVITDEINPLRLKVQQTNQALTENKSLTQTTQERIVTTREHQKTLQQQLQQNRHALQELEREQAKLEGLQQAALGRNDQTITPWLKTNALESNRRLGQEIKVEAGWEKAVETVLSGYFDAVCVEQVDSFVTKLGAITNGRITLLDNTPSSTASLEEKSTLLASYVKSHWPLQQWLQGIYVAQTEEEALAMRSELAAQESIITKEGVWIGKNWIRVSKVKDPQSGILARETHLKALAINIDEKRQCLSTIEQEQTEIENTLQQLEKTRDELQIKQQGLSREFTATQAELNKKEAQLEGLQVQQQRLQTELAELISQREATELALSQAESKRDSLISQKQKLAEQREELQRAREKLRTELESKRNEAQKEQKFADELEIRLSSNESQLALLRQTLRRDEKQLAQLEARREELRNNLHADDSPLEHLNQELQQKLNQRLEIEKQLNAAKVKLANLREELIALEEKKQRVLELIESIRNAIQQLQMDAQEVVVRSQTIIEQLQEVGLELEQVLANLTPEAEVTEWERKLNEVTQRISRLGPINLAAIDEHKESSERKEYLDKQYEDLTESLDVLQSAIAKIDKETKNRFRETFDEVNKGFQNIFPRVFGGGKASLELSENDLLTTGIVVKAQPPGKRNANIHMLSGGEKALTAIALVFSMFSLNPAPFCILDEVDAPLDDLNVGRFCQLVKEMSKETQFLIISHNKVTIESADHLMGVTMQEPGVSRLVAVDMEEALEMVEAV